VISGLVGEAERLIDAFVRGEIEQYRFLPCRGRRRDVAAPDGSAAAMTGVQTTSGRQESHVGNATGRARWERTANGTRMGRCGSPADRNEG
jgi:hypothetical protein